VRHWPLWTLKRSALAYWLLVDALALAAVVYAIVTSSQPTPGEVGRFAAIAGTAGAVVIGSSIHSHRVGEAARNPWAAHLCYLTAGLLALPCNLLVLLLFGPALHGVLTQRPESHRWVFTLSATTLAVFATRCAIGWDEPRTDLVAVVLGSTVLLLVRAGLIALGLKLRSPRAKGEEVIGEPIDVVLGVVAVSIGGLMGFVAAATPVHVLLAGPPLALLERASQLPQWRRSAQRDAKTGLANAVHWDSRARYELAKARGRDRPMAVMLLDLDHFKRVNDEVGHLAGDSALNAVALLLTGTVRSGDLVGRFGGEEFVVLLPDTDHEGALQAAETLRARLDGLAIPGVIAHLTASLGVATLPDHAADGPALIRAADRALYVAKADGRNRVRAAVADAAPVES
jgi:diguanylate cyclase (GGDEF)-like protein